MPNRRSSLSSSSSSAYSSSPSKSPPVKTPTTSRRRRRATEPSTTSSSSAKSRRRRRRRRPRRAAEPSSTSTTPTKPRRRRRKRAAKPSSTSSSSPQSSSPSNSPPGKKGAKKVGSEKKLHKLFVCENEKNEAQSLISFRRKKIIQYARPIGQQVPVKPAEDSTTTKKDSNKPKKHPELQSFGCRVLRAIESFIRLLHSMNLTLEGKLNVEVLCWIQSSKSVKLRKDSNLDLTEYTDERAKKDYSSIGVSIRDDLFIGKGLNPPADVLAWIDLMLADPLKDKYLLRYNTALLPRRAKMDLFLALYEKLLQVKELDEASKARYESVIKNIHVGASKPDYVWMTSAYENIYVQQVYEHNRQGRYSSVFELLRFVRDCIHHLMDYSVQDNVVMFSVDDKYLMIEACFPGVFHEFQKAMADAGLKEGHHGI